MKLIILALIILLLGGCTSELESHVQIIGGDSNSSLDNVGKVDPDYIDSDVGNVNNV